MLVWREVDSTSHNLAGGNHFVIGGGVAGGRIFGEHPADLTEASAINIGRGRFIPKLPWECIWNALAQWFGATNSDLDYIMPNRGNFASSQLLRASTLFPGDRRRRLQPTTSDIRMESLASAVDAIQRDLTHDLTHDLIQRDHGDAPAPIGTRIDRRPHDTRRRPRTSAPSWLERGFLQARLAAPRRRRDYQHLTSMLFRRGRGLVPSRRGRGAIHGHLAAP